MGLAPRPCRGMRSCFRAATVMVALAPAAVFADEAYLDLEDGALAKSVKTGEFKTLYKDLILGAPREKSNEKDVFVVAGGVDKKGIALNEVYRVQLCRRPTHRRESCFLVKSDDDVNVPATRWTVEADDDNHVRLTSHQGLYLTARHRLGTSVTVENETTAEGVEQAFELKEHEDNRWTFAFRTPHHGRRCLEYHHGLASATWDVEEGKLKILGHQPLSVGHCPEGEPMGEERKFKMIKGTKVEHSTMVDIGKKLGGPAAQISHVDQAVANTSKDQAGIIDHEVDIDKNVDIDKRVGGPAAQITHVDQVVANTSKDQARIIDDEEVLKAELHEVNEIRRQSGSDASDSGLVKRATTALGVAACCFVLCCCFAPRRQEHDA